MGSTYELVRFEEMKVSESKTRRPRACRAKTPPAVLSEVQPDAPSCSCVTPSVDHCSVLRFHIGHAASPLAPPDTLPVPAWQRRHGLR